MPHDRRIFNGVDTERLDDTMAELKERPERARFRFRAVNRWASGAHCTTTIQDFDAAGEEDTSRTRPFVLDADEPDVLLGRDHGPNATEAALYALSSCLSTTFAYYAAAQRVPLNELEIELEGEVDVRGFLGLAHDVRRGFREIHATFKVDADAPREKIEELCELAQKRSPVFDIVTNATPVVARAEERRPRALGGGGGDRPPTR